MPRVMTQTRVTAEMPKPAFTARSSAVHEVCEIALDGLGMPDVVQGR
jgi:hypothetical protein